MGGIPIAVRHIESVIRMSEVWARLHLRDHVRSDDIDHAIEMLLESFLQSQKVSVARQLGKKFEKYRTRQKDTTQLLLHTLKNSIKERANYQRVTQNIAPDQKIQVRLNTALFQNDARDFDQHNLNDFYNSMVF